MRSVVTVRRGVMRLPAKLRKALGIKGSDQFIAEATAEGMLLRPVRPPIEMYDANRIAEFDAAEAELDHVLRRMQT